MFRNKLVDFQRYSADDGKVRPWDEEAGGAAEPGGSQLRGKDEPGDQVQEEGGDTGWSISPGRFFNW